MQSVSRCSGILCRDQKDLNGNLAVVPLLHPTYRLFKLWRRQSKFALAHAGGAR
jgi:hypothetical protein